MLPGPRPILLCARQSCSCAYSDLSLTHSLSPSLLPSLPPSLPPSPLPRFPLIQPNVLQLYQAYGDYSDMMELVEELVESLAIAIHGQTKVAYQVGRA